ncbi:hypothetical protein HCN51_57285 [Nonomuraea sp. FMUSA5-5]|uniref:Transposase IS4 N-terminal domain-containing protein n=1 Tax=Nonomuraea composti TaxID=2720023 RepID=A0ABX1BRL2_9ACTN|nr:hypothetical protein [Nonomuraea sp. FMUSA5-5]
MRALPSCVGVYVLLAMCLFAEVGYLLVWQRLTASLTALPVVTLTAKALRGLLFRISAATRVSVDFAGFAERYGAGYADRLKLVRLPECALTGGCERRRTPSLKDGTDRPVVPSLKSGTKLSAQVPAGLFAVTAGPEGEEGSFKATPLALSGDWQVITGSGNFTYNYDVPLQQAPAGPTPSLSLSYSSGTVDGMVSGKNTQSGPIGLGWETSPMPATDPQPLRLRAQQSHGLLRPQRPDPRHVRLRRGQVLVQRQGLDQRPARALDSRPAAGGPGAVRSR